MSMHHDVLISDQTSLPGCLLTVQRHFQMRWLEKNLRMELNKSLARSVQLMTKSSEITRFPVIDKISIEYIQLDESDQTTESPAALHFYHR